MADIEKNLNAFPALWRLRALMPGGLGAVHSSVFRALDQDDYSLALKLANERYASQRGDDYAAALTYACLLVGRELVVEARGVITRALETHLRDRALCALLADALVIEGEVARAREILGQISHRNLERPGVAAFIADIYLDLGDEIPDDECRAIDFYQYAIDAGIDDPEPAIRLGQLYMASGRLFEAAEALEYGARLSRDRLGLWQMTADLWFEVGEDARGLDAKLRALRLADPEPEAWLELGFEFAQIAAFKPALDALDKVEQLLHYAVRTAEADQLYVEMLLVRGDILLELGRAEEALVAFQNLENRAGEHPSAQRGQAEAALLIGDLELADTCARRAVALRPEDPDARYILGCVHQQFGNHAEAIVEFQAALTDDADPPVWLAALALSQAFLQQIEAARETLTRAVAQVTATPELRPLPIDTGAWGRFIARLAPAAAADAQWFEAQINILSSASSESEQDTAGS